MKIFFINSVIKIGHDFRKEREENSKMVVESWIMGKLLDFNHQSLTLRFMEVAKRGDMHSKGRVIKLSHKVNILNTNKKIGFRIILK